MDLEGELREILRKKLGFRGYMHLKIMPGSERGQVERTMQLADRVSVLRDGTLVGTSGLPMCRVQM
jgi:predicted DNA-binding helix-hairpin-helix protein